MSSKLQVGYSLELGDGCCTLSNQGGKGPEGWPETLAVEMLGVAPGLLASPGGPCAFFCFLLFQVRHIAIKRENKGCFLGICFISNKYKHIYIKSI